MTVLSLTITALRRICHHSSKKEEIISFIFSAIAKKMMKQCQSLKLPEKPGVSESSLCHQFIIFAIISPIQSEL